MITALGKPNGAPAFKWLDIPTKNKLREPHPFLLPHEFLQSFYANKKKEWSHTIRGPAGATQQFWNSVKYTDFIQNHPMLKGLSDNAMSKIVPLGFHGDGGAYSKEESVYVFSWSSLLGTGATLNKRFIFTVVRDTDLAAGTIDAIFLIFAWSVNTLLSGQSPTSDFQVPEPNGGKPLADGWRGALVQVRGDWAFIVKVFQLPAWNTAERMCWICKRSNINRALAWTDFRKYVA